MAGTRQQKQQWLVTLSPVKKQRNSAAQLTLSVVHPPRCQQVEVSAFNPRSQEAEAGGPRITGLLPTDWCRPHWGWCPTSVYLESLPHQPRDLVSIYVLAEDKSLRDLSVCQSFVWIGEEHHILLALSSPSVRSFLFPAPQYTEFLNEAWRKVVVLMSQLCGWCCFLLVCMMLLVLLLHTLMNSTNKGQAPAGSQR